MGEGRYGRQGTPRAAPSVVIPVSSEFSVEVTFLTN